jgi:hypothetical protein
MELVKVVFLRFINDKIINFNDNSEKNENSSVDKLKEQIITRDDIFSTKSLIKKTIFLIL